MSTQQISDAELAGQPAAYWTGVAYEALIAFTRARQAEKGYTQPQFWLLRNLSKNDISPDGAGLTVPELRAAMASYLRPEDDLTAEAVVLVERGWLTRDADQRLWLTEEGEQARVDLARNAPAIRAAIHAGIDDADYVTALKVLRQLIRNTGGTVD
ncbi:MarR family winged helix-turn-helix transcriptional regulator [Kitasatospora purpeofusca]|uniref:MarR family winged helix-turn-helix transcriptional regulator n=1 Tax=Kitasatospora purpeofusca TaxID=67352 RepID=UPI00224CD88E|nr:MarR family winged helix-turn-helix transcriptional regulator [Kitasatospora purpeofusca]MCX4755463.1 MarR family winged helix-turn-helix transcriptional regulator [Kitasatospora purpeofusca]WSR36666.1 MarR family winged helix-turn-helix transcriptional regulator [Kitasatospora purpeofusca]WSR44948.1 MarR family winged helix-turn-helix transcriptional regulator [Kitasatospora purpeofusca]